MALGLGAADNDRVPTRWESMFLPDALRDTVRERFGVAPEQLHEQLAFTLPTSPHVGRGMLVLVGFLLFALLRLSPKWLTERRALVAASVLLGTIALGVDALSAVVPWPEVRNNWALLCLLPSDIAIPWLAARPRRKYLLTRLGLTLLLMFASLVGLISQPLWPIGILVAVPILTMLLGMNGKTTPKAGRTR